MVRRVMVCAAFVLLGLASSALAQSDRSVWGFSGSFVPQWKTPSQLAILFDADRVDITGSEFRVGVVRGRPTGGDWGVSFVRKKFKEGSSAAENPSDFCFNNGCVQTQSSALFQNVSITGIEAHRFFPFATIKRRAQIGLTVAGGVGSWKGTVRMDNVDVEFVGNAPVLVHSVEEVPMQDFFVLEKSIVPLFRLELAGAAIVSDNFKLRVGGGINFPGTQAFSVQGIFLLPQ